MASAALLALLAPLAGAAVADRATAGDAALGHVPALATSERWVAPAELFAAAEQALKPLLEARGARVELTMPRDAVRGVVVDAGAVELAARALPGDFAWSSRIAVWVDIRQAGATRRSVLVPVQVQAWQAGWKAVRDLPAGTRLSQTLLERGEVDVAAGGQPAWQGDPEGQSLRAPVMAGRYLGASQVTPAHAVARGERVELVHRMGVVEVLAAASALQDGEIGQHVQVRVDASQGPVMARVVAPGRVELQR
ncbi:flagellar basal body P-ring formation chaperone FlgA [Ideonella sp. YS5]|uniref:flagellar basal body P-ring formation chaperone FlgA n=1 Tax=Ideonella sp. YS5 TaxID=3453714 RepID=UPI003EEC86FA